MASSPSSPCGSPRVGNRQLVDVVQQESARQLGIVGLLGDDRPGQERPERMHALDVAAGAIVLRLDRSRVRTQAELKPLGGT
jgi:hypothetical protein